MLKSFLGKSLRARAAKARSSATRQSCIIQLQERVENGKVGSFSPLDLPELKPGLLNYGL